MSKTTENLKKVFAEKAGASQRFLAFALRSADENLDGIYKLFEALATSETLHAQKHLAYVRGVRNTQENLRELLESATDDPYPRMIAEAKEEGAKGPEISLSHAKECERLQADLYKKALELGEKFPVQDYFLCEACGYLASGAIPKVCPVCGVNEKGFFDAFSPASYGRTKKLAR
jgi:rubrerythrin